MEVISLSTIHITLTEDFCLSFLILSRIVYFGQIDGVIFMVERKCCNSTKTKGCS